MILLFHPAVIFLGPSDIRGGVWGGAAQCSAGRPGCSLQDSRAAAAAAGGAAALPANTQAQEAQEAAGLVNNHQRGQHPQVWPLPLLLPASESFQLLRFDRMRRPCVPSDPPKPPWQVDRTVEDGCPVIKEGPRASGGGSGPAEALLEGRQLPALLE